MKINKTAKKAAVIMMTAASLCGYTSCGNKENNSTTEDTVSVETVTEPVVINISDTLASRYNKEFFDNAANKSAVATDSTWEETPSGLKFAMLKDGTGTQPTATDAVTVHYIGHLTDGKIFDSSVARGEAITFPLSGVIPGWTEGLQLMKTGGVAVFYIPANLAYGDRESPEIPANSDLIFDVQLIDVQKQQAQPRF